MLKNAIESHHIKDCPVTVEDTEISEKMFGPDIHALKGKTVHKTPFAVTINAIEMPKETLNLHKDAALGIDFMCANGLCLFVVVRRWHCYFGSPNFQNPIRTDNGIW